MKGVISAPPFERGSLQEAIILSYTCQEQEADILKTKLITMSAFMPEQDEWNKKAHEHFREYVSVVLGENEEDERQEEDLIKYYQDVIKNTDVRIRKNENKELEIVGLEQIL